MPRVATQADRCIARAANCSHNAAECPQSLPHPLGVQTSPCPAECKEVGAGSTDTGGRNSGGRTPRCAPQATARASAVGTMIVSNPATRAAAAAPRGIRAGAADRTWDETSSTVAVGWDRSEAEPPPPRGEPGGVPLWRNGQLSRVHLPFAKKRQGTLLRSLLSLAGEALRARRSPDGLLLRPLGDADRGRSRDLPLLC